MRDCAFVLELTLELIRDLLFSNSFYAVLKAISEVLTSFGVLMIVLEF